MIRVMRTLYRPFLPFRNPTVLSCLSPDFALHCFSFLFKYRLIQHFSFLLSFLPLQYFIATHFSAQRAYFFHGIYRGWHQVGDRGWGGWHDYCLEGERERERERERESLKWRGKDKKCRK